MTERDERKAGASFVVERLGHDGDGVVETPRGKVFVRGALPGDRIVLGKIGKDGSVMRGELGKLVEASPERVPSACEIEGRCGGCPLIAASGALTARFKAAPVERALAKGGLRLEVEVTRVEPMLGYRQRARLSFVSSARGLMVGYHAPGRRDVVDVPRCVVLAPPLSEALAWIKRELRALSGRGELHLGSSSASGAPQPVLWLTSETPQQPAVYRALETAVAAGTLAGAQLSVGGAGPVVFGQAIETSTDVDGRLLRFPLGGFRQAHGAAPARLGEAVIELLAPEEESVLELHAGHGTFTLALAARATSVTAVEVSAPAARALSENLAQHDLRAEVHALDGAAFLELLLGNPFRLSERSPGRLSPREVRGGSATLALPAESRAESGTSLRTAALAKAKKGRFGCVVLDPPRAGARELVGPIAALQPKRIVYVSCNPETLGRDLELFREAGYGTTDARAFDLFAQTAHVETVALLQPR